MQDIAQFEARKFYYKHRYELDNEESELRKEEEIVDLFLAMATSFFLTSWILVALRAYGIWG